VRFIEKKESPPAFEAWKTYEFGDGKRKNWKNDWKGYVPIEDRIAGHCYYTKRELRTYLIEEQESLCCYCETKIEDAPLKAKIEHIIPRDGDKNQEVIYDYNNLAVCCLGGEKDPKPKEMHCDSSRDDSMLLPIKPHDPRCELEITYAKDGQINGSTDEAKETIKQLNLQILKLENSREEAISGFIYSDEDLTILISKEDASKVYRQIDSEKPCKHISAVLQSLKSIME